MSEPKQKPGRSKQDYGTPPEFLVAVKALLGIKGFALDVAATAENAVCPSFVNESQDGLSLRWASALTSDWAWCNPPYGDIGPWTAKAYAEKCVGVQTAMLIPASVGANWWRDHVHNKAHVLFLNGRVTFVGCTDPYPRDCALLLYSYAWQIDYDVWTWKESGRKLSMEIGAKVINNSGAATTGANPPQRSHQEVDAPNA